MIKYFKNNPELERNLLIEFTLARKAAMPLLLLAVYFLISLYFLKEVTFHSILQMSLIWGIIILVNIWGTKLAVDSIIGEQNDRTWDNQRMTLLSPMQMLIGKLFGSTIFAWYGGLICSLFYVITLLYSQNIVVELFILINTLLSGLFLHIVSIILSLFAVKKFRHKSKIGSILYVLLTLVSAYTITMVFISNSYLSHTVQRNAISNIDRIVYWFGIKCNREIFTFFSIGFLISWAVVGLYYSIKKELHYKTDTKMYILFFVSSFLFLSGLFIDFNIPKGNYLLSFTIAMVCALMFFGSYFYLVALNEPKNHIELKKFYEKLISKDYANLYDITPVWLLTLVCIFVTVIVLQIMILLNLNTIYSSTSPAKDLFEGKTLNIFFPINFAIILARDLCIILYANTISKYKKPDTTAFIFLMAFYFLGVMFLGGIFHSTESIAMIMPFLTGNIFTALIVPLIELGVIGYLLSIRIRAVFYDRDILIEKNY